MSRFSMFMKENKIGRENERYAVTKGLCDENGEPLEWEFRHISSKENDSIRESCTVEEIGNGGAYRTKLKAGQYISKLIAASVVYPDLYDAELQDSYGVKTPEELLYAMVDDPGEYNSLAAFIQKFQGFDTTFEERVEQAKN